ncbi:YEATS domain-containing protein 2-like [Actinia tenebrosa]|uniref:YEATS domain-containing protein 2 n=1 Tax=Actinia tenebrosa TaxID=6105 RepID=A0A6P8IQY0_ACTTE|nr:YEATS domain-containing protein 2-like [Actinia tenebrosa]
MDFSSSENAENNQENGIEDCQGITETVDPDYVSILPEKLQSKVCLSEQQQDAKDNAVQKIKNIVRKQFTMEMHLKEQEIETIDQRIRQTKTSLDRLRACILARYYGMSQDFQEESLIRSFAGKSSWSKPRRSRRECANNQSSSKVLKSNRSKLLNSTGSFSARNLGNSQLSPSMDINANKPPLGKKSSSFEDNKNPVSSALFDFENTACVNLEMTNGEAERTSVVAKVSALATSGNSNLSASMTKGSQQQSIVTSDISITHSSVASTSSLGSHSSRYLDLKGIQLNASGTHLSASRTHLSASGTQSNASGTLSSTSLQRSNLVDTQAKKVMKSHLAVTSSEETSKNSQGRQLNGSSILKVTHMNATKDAVSQSNAFGSGARFYVKKRVIIGNTSKYIPPEKREENDKSTHKWMVYVRGPPEDPHIDVYIQKVWFFLHPSYRPNDIIEVNKPPFHLTRRGWGEFPIRVQLHFVGTRNKRVDIIHELKLDKTYTGLQTLGAETVVDLEIDKKTFEDLGIPVSWEIPQDTSSASDTTSKTDINSIKNPEVVKLKREHSSSATSSETGQLPGASSIKRSRLDTPMSSVASTPCGSRISSRCASPVLRNTSEILEDGTEDYLHSFAEKIPLISSKKDVVKHPFSAKSAEEFLSWNVGKRRAAEWQRAAKIRAQFKKCAQNTDMTTKGVMIWCRRFGYTPQENLVTDEKVEYCKICGKIIEQVTKENLDTGIVFSCTGEKCSKVAQMELSSLTLVEDILKEVEDKEKLFNETSSQKESEEDVDIDVVSSFDTKKPSVSIPNSLGTISIPLTPQQQWIKDICNDISISLRPLTIQNVEVNAIESMLLKLAMKFAETLLRKASSLSKKDDASLDPNLIIPFHIYQAIGSLSLCDFMGNAFFGHASEDQP